MSPEDNLVGALLAVARARGSEAIVGAVSRLRRWTDERRGGALDRAVAEWLKSVISGLDAGLERELAAANTTSEVMEVIKPTGKWAVRWYEDGLDDGRAQGIEQGIERGIEQQLRLLRRLVARKFGAEVAREIVGSVEALAAPDVVGVVFDAAIDCDGTDEFLAAFPARGCHARRFPEMDWGRRRFAGVARHRADLSFPRPQLLPQKRQLHGGVAHVAAEAASAGVAGALVVVEDHREP